MGNLVEELTFVVIIFAHQGASKPCNTTNQIVTGSWNERCNESTILQDGGDNEAINDFSGIASHTVYTIVIVLGVVLIPIVVLIRICWVRKLQRQRHNAINEVRNMVNQRFLEERQRRGVFSIDLANVPFEDIFGKPPTYEESLANPCTGCPPPYEQPPCYKQKEFDENDNLTIDQINEQDPAPSTSSDS